MKQSFTWDEIQHAAYKMFIVYFVSIVFSSIHVTLATVQPGKRQVDGNDPETTWLSFNPLLSNIKIQILLACPHMFSIEVVVRVHLG